MSKMITPPRYAVPCAGGARNHENAAFEKHHGATMPQLQGIVSTDVASCMGKKDLLALHADLYGYMSKSHNCEYLRRAVTGRLRSTRNRRDHHLNATADAVCTRNITTDSPIVVHQVKTRGVGTNTVNHRAPQFAILLPRVRHLTWQYLLQKGRSARKGMVRKQIRRNR